MWRDGQLSLGRSSIGIVRSIASPVRFDGEEVFFQTLVVAARFERKSRLDLTFAVMCMTSGRSGMLAL